MPSDIRRNSVDSYGDLLEIINEKTSYPKNRKNLGISGNKSDVVEKIDQDKPDSTNEGNAFVQSNEVAPSTIPQEDEDRNAPVNNKSVLTQSKKVIVALVADDKYTLNPSDNVTHGGQSQPDPSSNDSTSTRDNNVTHGGQSQPDPSSNDSTSTRDNNVTHGGQSQPDPSSNDGTSTRNNNVTHYSQSQLEPSSNDSSSTRDNNVTHYSQSQPDPSSNDGTSTRNNNVTHYSQSQLEPSSNDSSSTRDNNVTHYSQSQPDPSSNDGTSTRDNNVIHGDQSQPDPSSNDSTSTRDNNVIHGNQNQLEPSSNDSTSARDNNVTHGGQSQPDPSSNDSTSTRDNNVTHGGQSQPDPSSNDSASTRDNNVTHGGQSQPDPSSNDSASTRDNNVIHGNQNQLEPSSNDSTSTRDNNVIHGGQSQPDPSSNDSASTRDNNVIHGGQSQPDPSSNDSSSTRDNNVIHGNQSQPGPSDARSDKLANPRQNWIKILKKLMSSYGDEVFESWLSSTRFLGTKDSKIMLSTVSTFKKEWMLSRNVDSQILAWWKVYDDSILEVKIVVGENRDEEDSDIIISENRVSSNKGLSSYVNSNFTFDNFVVGGPNEIAFCAAKEVASSKAPICGSNPLFLYGGVGLGKTHLMHAIGNHIKSLNDGRKIIYLSAEKFMNKYVSAVQDKNIESFRSKIRSADVLMVDDLQFIIGKKGTQEEFLHTFNDLMESRGKQIITSADRSPGDLEIREHIQSRMSGGLVAIVSDTDFDLRFNILRSKVSSSGVDIDDEIIDFIARKIDSNVRELQWCF